MNGGNIIISVLHFWIRFHCWHVLQSATWRWRYHQHWCNCKFTPFIITQRNSHTILHVISQAGSNLISYHCLFLIGVFGWLPWWHLRNLLDWSGWRGWEATGGNRQALQRWIHRCLQTRCTALCYWKYYQVHTYSSTAYHIQYYFSFFLLIFFCTVCSEIAHASGFQVCPYFIGHGIGSHFHCHPEIWHHGEFESVVKC